MKVIAVYSEESAWDCFVESAQDATPYHQLRWRDVITKSFGHSHYPAAIDDEGEWQGVLPLVHMRSRFFGNFLVSVETETRRCSGGTGQRKAVWKDLCHLSVRRRFRLLYTLPLLIPKKILRELIKLRPLGALGVMVGVSYR